MKPASHIEDLLARHCEGLLPEPEARMVEAHLEACAACRAAEAEVRRGLGWTRALESVTLPEEDEARIRRGLEAAPGVGAPARWFRIAGAAALVVLLLTIRFPARAPEVKPQAPRPGPGGLFLQPEPGEPTRFEQTALDLHDAHAENRLALDLRSSSVPEVRRWAEDSVGLGVSIAVDRPPEDGKGYVVEGARKVEIGGVTALAVAYRVSGRPVTLLTANASDVPDRTPGWGSGGKRVRFRTLGRHKLLAWTNSGQTYALVSDLPGYGQQSCLLCHTTAARREAIRALGQPSR